MTKAQYKALDRADRIARNGGTSWSTGRKSYWKAIAEAEIAGPSGVFSTRNIMRMQEGLAPRMRIRLFHKKTQRYLIRDVSMELHHKFLPQRGGSSLSHSFWNLEKATPWAHEAMDPFRHLGYELDSIIKGTNSF